mmetsp:Transcript_7868/g.17611  ORF Transcript_7868/g.17611 Transcript_7868/m.17611 type:complete len:295 (-) Transcript_7868:1125-2009(-)
MWRVCVSSSPTFRGSTCVPCVLVSGSRVPVSRRPSTACSTFQPSHIRGHLLAVPLLQQVLARWHTQLRRQAPAPAGPEAALDAPLLARLPDEIASIMFEQVGLVAVGRLGLACRACRAFSKRWLMQLELVRLDARARQWSDRRVLSLLSVTGGARALMLEGKHLPNFSSFSRLSELAICPRLEQLKLTDCLNLQPQHLPLLCGRCCRLSHLDLSGCAFLTDACLVVLASLHQLSSLHLTRCAQLSAASLQRVARRCPSLEHVDFSHSGEGTQPLRPCQSAAGRRTAPTRQATIR